LGNPVRVVLTAGQAHDLSKAKELIEGYEPGHVIADKGYDSDDFVEAVEARGAKAVVPPRSNRKASRAYDEHLYKERNKVERFLNRAKHYRRVATRYEKTGRNFLEFWQFVSVMVLLM
jgi:transposase